MNAFDPYFDRTGDQIRAIFFDFGGTLDSPGVPWRERFYSCYVRAGIHVPFERFTEAFYRADDSLVAECPSRMDLEEVVHEQVRRVFNELGIRDWIAQGEVARLFLDESLRQIRRNIEILSRMRQRFRIGIISNNYGNLEAICRQTGLIHVADVMVDSRILGAQKPSPAIFMAALKAMGAEPFEAVMVGDSLHRDVKGARAVGMHPVWLVPEYMKAAASALRLNVPVISSLAELERLLSRALV